MLKATMRERFAASAIERAFADTPVVLINGARQCGKSTLAQWLAEERFGARYLTLDDAATLTAASRDPVAFVEGLDPPVVIDEVQYVPELFRAIKLAVDRSRKPGRFLLTGSANVLLLPRISESLAGRMEIITLQPFSAGEIDGAREGFIDAVFANRLTVSSGTTTRSALFRRVVNGGYPEVIGRRDADRRRAWFGAYVTTVLQRDIREIANIEGLTQMPRLLALLATQSANLLNIASLSRDTGVSQPTLKKYLTLLEATFLFQPLAPWAANLGKRLIKTPKAFLNDSGLAAYLLGLDAEVFDDPLASGSGPLLETFVVQEVRKQMAWSDTRPTAYFLRTAGGREVDLILEDRRRRVVAIEVKAGASISRNDLKALEELSGALGKRFVRGVLLYGGRERLDLGARLTALPLAALWRR